MTDYPDHEQLRKYLLGTLPSEAVEQLDERSIADDQFAARLNDVENDLVDAYVRGELSQEVAARFKSVYDSTPKQRQKLAFAQTLYALQESTGPSRVQVESRKLRAERGWSFTLGRWFVPQWGLAAAAFLLLFASGYLAVSNRQLQRQLNQSESQRAALAQQQQDLHHQLESRTDGSLPSLDRVKIATFVLAPALRSSSLPTFTLTSDTDLVVLKLGLETSGFTKYTVSVEDSVSRRTLWRSGDLTPSSENEQPAVSFAVRSSLLKPGIYLIQLTGIRASGSTVLVSTNPFRVELK